MLGRDDSMHRRPSDSDRVSPPASSSGPHRDVPLSQHQQNSADDKTPERNGQQKADEYPFRYPKIVMRFFRIARADRLPKQGDQNRRNIVHPPSTAPIAGGLRCRLSRRERSMFRLIDFISHVRVPNKTTLSLPFGDPIAGTFARFALHGHDRADPGDKR